MYKIAAIWMQLGYAETLKPGVRQQMFSQVWQTRVSSLRPKKLQQEASESLCAEYVNKLVLKTRARARTRAAACFNAAVRIWQCAYQCICKGVCYVNNACC